MKKILLLCLSLVAAPSAYASTPLGGLATNFPCYDFLELKQKLEREHEEIPFLSGEGISNFLNMQTEKFQTAAHKWYIFANPKSYQYTLVFKLEAGDNGIGCVASTGGNLGPVVQDGI
jgi:hypothetical protein